MGISWLKERWTRYRQSRFPSFWRIRRALTRKSAEQPGGLAVLSGRDQALVDAIREQTRQHNRSNVTRTMAYLQFYLRHPEIHWALLGHMVSRNGGWNMTDIKGELLSRLLSRKEQEDFFAFLERGNWLIFHDVYPQMLVYEESVKRQANLFYLLPHLHVSRFMQVLWEEFWRFGDCEQLAIGLVINEQSYLEKHVIRQPHYQQTVLHTLEFKLQELLGLNQILFPCLAEGRGGDDGKPVLIGQTLRHFASLPERIALGKRLYALLFRDPDVLRAVTGWAVRQPHTGSRKDYWPHLFHDVNESVPGAPYKRKLANCRLLPGAARLYSPRLVHAWGDVTHAEPEPEDWCTDARCILFLLNENEEAGGDVEDAYCQTLEKIERAIVAKEAIFPA
jgi:hypothetical protein